MNNDNNNFSTLFNNIINDDDKKESILSFLEHKGYSGLLVLYYEYDKNGCDGIIELLKHY